MRRILVACLIGALFAVPSAGAMTIDAQVEGPLLTKERVLEFVRQNLEGDIASTPDLGDGGSHRLFVRVASKYTGSKSRFLYFTEVQLQRRVTEADTGNRYWASIRSAVLWGTVPTENEVRDALAKLMGEKVSRWRTE
jgi:hypothetical protein